jgi:hypothetical protein
MRSRLTAVAAFAAGLALFVGLAAVPFVTRKREFPAAITSPPALDVVSLDTVPPRTRLCMAGMTAEPHSRIARFEVGTYGRPGPPLELTVAAPGYRTSAHVRGGYADNLVQAVPIAPPRHAWIVTVCIRNGGAHKIALYSAGDRARSRAVVAEGRKQLAASPAFGFWESRRHSIAQRAGLSAQRIAVFRGPLGYTWVVWLVLALAAVALSLGLGLALWRSLSSSRSSSSASF